MGYKPPGSDKLSPQKLQAIQLYLGERMPWIKIAEKLGISRTALYNWRSEQLFIDELNRQHTLLVQEVVARTAANLTFSADVLKKLMIDEKTAPEHKLKAAKELIEMGFRNLEFISNLHFTKRLTELEEKIDRFEQSDTSIGA